LKLEFVLLAFIIVFGFLWLGFQQGLEQISVEEAGQIQEQIRSQTQQSTVNQLFLKIFINNFYRFGEFLCPFLGVFFCAFSSYQTGYVLAYAAVLNPQFSFEAFIMQPIVLVELFCYVGSLSIGMWLTYVILERRWREVDTGKLISTIMLLLLMLAVAAYLEACAILG